MICLVIFAHACTSSSATLWLSYMTPFPQLTFLTLIQSFSQPKTGSRSFMWV